MRIANTGDIDPHELELGAHVGTVELWCRNSISVSIGVVNKVRQHVFGGDARHIVAGGDQTENAAVPQRAFADGVDVRIGGEAAVVDDNAAAVADPQTGCAGQL